MKDLQRGVNSEAQAKSFANLLSTRIDKVIEEISTQGPILIVFLFSANLRKIVKRQTNSHSPHFYGDLRPCIFASMGLL